ncbi:Exodeoxyribonuclease V alpha chain [Bhargavaea cecembensis DSE10]|uniref:ATP-dependent RecD2 DNA helicase n=1 Tax=Bhargavaea cecembensis DSE10 TaxID=1235279 RepID=M7NFA1_9BACL|nr:ATP-dependent RecD-like DNA helicase [Bhargavaea cecembensis]EMR05856.1 Exodeoxyribonuclease V alpha chain [Bhargavaea cecembensis DSE10]
MAGQMDLFKEDEQYLTGRPVATVFHNPQNLFSILRVKVTATDSGYDGKEIVVAGYFPPLEGEDTYKFRGSLVEHPKYGTQFKASVFTKDLPDTETGLVHYLSSDLFPGIGQKTAQSIVRELGKDTISLILNDPSALDRVPRLSDERKETIVSVLQENMGLERIMIALNEWGFGPQLAMRIYQTYREETVSVLQTNPYRLIGEIEGVGFQRADELGARLGITGDHKDRVKAAVLHLLNMAALSEGHVFMEAEALLPEAKRMLEASQPHKISFEAITQAIIELGEESKIVVEQKRCYLPSLYFSEIGIASKVVSLLEDVSHKDAFPQSEIRKALGGIEERLGVTYAKTQVEAIELALHSSFMILTGGPGTGKTTVIRGLVELYAELHGLSLDPKDYVKKEEAFPIVLAAPTGRAAKRMSESTELPAMTIHRLLGFTGMEREEETERELDGRLFIIDEVSMVDTWLAHQLMKAIPDGAQVIFVGDQDQLPPVGPGQVLKDLLASKQVPAVELTDIYRQSSGSSIIELAHRVKKGQVTDDLGKKTSDRSFIKAGTPQIPEAVEKVLKSAISKGQSIHDVQVLAPMYKGPAGIDNLNKLIQEIVNPAKEGRKETVFGDITYRIGDKVLQLVNQPESNVFNGDIGEVVAIMKPNETVDKKEMIVVSFDGLEVTYERKDLSQLTLAYCISIHKSQGSEFGTVIMPVVRTYRRMLRRNLLYTGLTRAKNFLILIGEPDVFREGIARGDDLNRRTTLMERVTGGEAPSAEMAVHPAEKKPDGTVADDETGTASEAPDDDSNLEPERPPSAEPSAPPSLSLSNHHAIDPMVGMDGVTPYDFMDGR